MTVTELLQHLSEGRRVKTKNGEFTKKDGYVKYRGTYADFDDTVSHLSVLLDEIGEGVWVEEPEPIVKFEGWGCGVCTVGPGFSLCRVQVKTEHVEAFEKHVESFKGEA